MLLIQLSPLPFLPYGGQFSFGGSAERHPIPSLHGEHGSSFPGRTPPNDTVNFKSMVGIKPGDSDVVIECQVNEFPCIWFAEHFIAWSHIYPVFMYKVSTLTHFPLEPGCDNYSFLDQAVEDFMCALDSILMDSQQQATTGCIV